MMFKKNLSALRKFTIILFSIVVGATGPLSPSQISNYRRDGVILIKGLITGRMLQNAQANINQLVNNSNRSTNSYRFASIQGWSTNPFLRSIAFNSDAPRISAELMGLNKTRPLRLMKDALMALSPGDKSCGWHVDDKFFWPCYDNPELGATDEGVNVWITLSPLLAREGGGLAVAPKSSRAIWREKCRKFIGTFDATNLAGNTCELATLSPKCHYRLESMKVLHDMEPGDALFASRYLFHKGEPFDKGYTKLRYSIRYMPADARIFDNRIEPAIQKKRLTNGSLLSATGAYYPQVWPRSILKERLTIRLGLLGKHHIHRERK